MFSVKSTTPRGYFWLLVLLSMISVGLALLWSAQRDYQNFKAAQHEIMQESVSGTATQITYLIENYQTALRIFADHQGPLLRKLVENPTDEANHSQLSRSLARYYPDYFSLTIADVHGDLIYDDFGEKVGDVCRRDIKSFANNKQQTRINVHPGPGEYHIDIMVPWTYGKARTGVFFASFRPTLFARLLDNSRVAGHSLYLVRTDVPDLIEVAAGGSRATLTRDIRLTPEEIKRIGFSLPVSGTNWTLIDVPETDIYTSRLQLIVVNSVITFLVFLFIASVLIVLIYREEIRRTLAEQTVRESRDQLEQRVVERTDELQKSNEQLQQKGREREIAEQQIRKLAGIVEQTDDLVLITDRQGIIEYANPAFSALSTYSMDEILGKTPKILNSGNHESAFFQSLWETILSGNIFRGVVINRKKDGTVFHEQKTITPLKDKDGHITHFVSTGKDITSEIQSQEQLHYLAHHDSLTGLPNRALLSDRLSHAMVQTQRNNRLLVVMLLDLDRFKTINDTLGHALGDELLRLVSTRLTECLRKGDTASRFGGDEFIIVLEGLSHVDGTLVVADKILRALAQPFSIGGRELFVTASLGITFYPFDDNDGMDSLLKQADTAMYRAKDGGGNGYQLFSHEMMARAMERLDLEGALRHALERDEFLLHYQPQIRLDTGEVVGMEALLRWQHPELGLIPPDRFIPLLEETGLIVAVGEWVLQTACRFNQTLQKAGHPPIRVAVNLSARQFQDAGLINMVARVLRETGQEPRYLDLEITESLLMENVGMAAEALRTLHRMGVRIFMDDFGTGYSSIAYLKRFTITGIKIDKSFVQDLLIDSGAVALVQGIIAMVGALHLGVIAEGVETKDQLSLLRGQGCHEAQGYLIARPLPPAALEQWLRQHDNQVVASSVETNSVSP